MRCFLRVTSSRTILTQTHFLSSLKHFTTTYLSNSQSSPSLTNTRNFLRASSICLGNVATPSAADNISVSNPFDDPIVGGNGPPNRTGPPYQSGATGSGGGGGSGSSVAGGGGGGVGAAAVGSGGPTGAPYSPIPNTAGSRPPQGTTPFLGLLRLFLVFIFNK